jgi:hypothetical protein
MQLHGLLGVDAPVANAAMWWQYNPNELIDIIVNKYNAKLPLPNSTAKKVVGKWVYYFRGNKFKDDIVGRLNASKIIAADLAREGSGTHSVDAVNATLLSARAYLLKELKLPVDARGPERITTRLVKTTMNIADETWERTKAAGQAIKEGTDPKNVVPDLFGGKGVLIAVGVIAAIYLTRRFR